MVTQNIHPSLVDCKGEKIKIFLTKEFVLVTYFLQQIHKSVLYSTKAGKR